jgi:hypothetical protein
LKDQQRQANDLHRLIRGQGLKHYGLFHVTGEGRRLPDGSEESSGYVLTDDRRVYFFWLTWDSQHEHVTFSEFKEVPFEPAWEEDEEYHEAIQEIAAGTRAR